jgi:hypothetical protein
MYVALGIMHGTDDRGHFQVLSTSHGVIWVAYAGSADEDASSTNYE